jgi:pyruvate carboxylase
VCATRRAINGQPRTIRVPDRSITSDTTKRPKAEDGNTAHVGAPMPGLIANLVAELGRDVKVGDLLLTIEAMKMETALHADRVGHVAAVHVQVGSIVDAKDILIEFVE